MKNKLLKTTGVCVIALGLSALAGCSSSSAGGGAITCTDVPGEPDIMGPITFTPTTASPGDTVTMHIPVDATTAFVGVELTGFSASSIVGGSDPSLASGLGYVTIATLGAQTVDVPMTIPAGSGAGSYMPTINICSEDVNACKKITGSAGIAVNYASNPISDTAPLTRFKYFANTNEITPNIGNLPTDSCVARPVLTVTVP